jgi:hypothetical protein
MPSAEPNGHTWVAHLRAHWDRLIHRLAKTKTSIRNLNAIYATTLLTREFAALQPRVWLPSAHARTVRGFSGETGR